MTDRARWALVTAVLLLLLAIIIWLVAADAAIIRFTVRLYQDKKFLKDTVRSWGLMAPVVFIAIAFMAIVIALCLPLYYYRASLIKRFHKPRGDKGGGEKALDGPGAPR